MNLKKTSSFIFAITLLLIFGSINPKFEQKSVTPKTVSVVSDDGFSNDIYQGENGYYPIEMPAFKINNELEISKQLSIVRLTLSELEQQKFNYVTHSDIDQIHVVLPVYKTDYISKQTQKNSVPNGNAKSIKKTGENSIATKHIGYWQTVHSIESKQGKLLYRPRNKSKNCNNTSGPCGHHQLTVQALKDIGCNSLQCRKDRLDYNKSLKLSKKLLALNEKRLRKNGISKLQGYKKYLIHQQGANGIKNIIAATQGKKVLSKKIKKNMANNSPFSYKQLKSMGSKNAAKKFMQHWEKKWVNEKRLILASQITTISKTEDNLIKTNIIPTFNDNELRYALNIRF